MCTCNTIFDRICHCITLANFLFWAVNTGAKLLKVGLCFDCSNQSSDLDDETVSRIFTRVL